MRLPEMSRLRKRGRFDDAVVVDQPDLYLIIADRFKYQVFINVLNFVL